MVGPEATVWDLNSGFRLATERRQGPGFAFDLRIPVGSAHDPVGIEGAAAVLEEWWSKGAAQRSARELQDAFDDLGVRRGGGVGSEATRISVSGLIDDLPAALDLVVDLVRRPTLPDGELPVLIDLARQDLEGLEDSPADLLAVRARALNFPRWESDCGAGYGHPTSGTKHGLARMSAERLRAHFNHYGLAGSILGVVCNLSAAEVLALVERAFQGWCLGDNHLIPTHFRGGQRLHVTHEESEQTHLNITAPGVSPRSPDWLNWQLALTALSGGSSSRLFQEVREERGLAYAVSASAMVLGGAGFLSVYAGSTPERAPDTLEVIQTELEKLPRGLSEAEFRRAHAGLSTSVVFGSESLRGRAHALTRDLALFGRVRAPAALRRELDALHLPDLNRFLADYRPMAQANITSLGPEGLA